MVTALGDMDKRVKKSAMTPGWWGIKWSNIHMDKYLVSAIRKIAKKWSILTLSPPKKKKVLPNCMGDKGGVIDISLT